MGFEISLEFKRFVFVGKGAVPNQLPGLEFSGVGGFAGIVLGEPPPQIRGGADVFLFGRTNAADDVNVPHKQ